MFEKDAEEIANKKLCAITMCYNHCNFNSPKHHRCGDWHRCYEIAKEGAEFGYNKANGKLTKAIKLLKFWIDDFYDSFSLSSKYEERHKARVETEQFLKEANK